MDKHYRYVDLKIGEEGGVNVWKRYLTLERAQELYGQEGLERCTGGYKFFDVESGVTMVLPSRVIMRQGAHGRPQAVNPYRPYTDYSGLLRRMMWFFPNVNQAEIPLQYYFGYHFYEAGRLHFIIAPSYGYDELHLEHQSSGKLPELMIIAQWNEQDGAQRIQKCQFRWPELVSQLSVYDRAIECDAGGMSGKFFTIWQILPVDRFARDKMRVWTETRARTRKWLEPEKETMEMSIVDESRERWHRIWQIYQKKQKGGEMDGATTLAETNG